MSIIEKKFDQYPKSNYNLDFILNETKIVETSRKRL